MKNQCCSAKQQQNKESRPLWPGLTALVAGVLMLISHHFSPLHWMLHSWAGSMFCFLFCTVSLIVSLKSDLKDHSRLAFSLALSSVLVLVASQVGVVSFVWGLNLLALGLFVQAFFLKPDGSWKASFSIESSIVVSSVLAWVCSVAGLFFSAHFPFGVFFHDSLLAVGAYQVGNYFRDMYRDQLMNSGDGYPRVMIEGQERDCLQLKSGQAFIPKSPNKPLLFPFPITATEFFGFVNSDAEESREKKENASFTIPAHTFFTYSKGTLEVKESPVQPNRAKKEEPQNFLFFIMMVSLASGAFAAWQSASVLAGFSQFAISIMGACPCVFVFSRPIIGIRAMRCAAEKGVPVNSDEIFKEPIDTFVFDRTNTLYHPPVLGADYQLSVSGSDLVKGLKDRGHVMVLSGHEGVSAEDRRRACARELNIPLENILFGCKEKRKQLDHIKSHGVFLGQIARGSSFRVMYVGDGENDINALDIADVAVAVGANTQVQGASHLRIDKDKIHKLLDLVDIIDQTAPWMKGLTAAAYAYNLIMLMMVNGLSVYLFAVPIQASVACLAMMVFSMLSLFASSRFNPTIAPSSDPACSWQLSQMSSHQAAKPFLGQTGCSQFLQGYNLTKEKNQFS